LGQNLNKKLSYRRGTTRRAMLVNSCYVSVSRAIRFDVMQACVRHVVCDMQFINKVLVVNLRQLPAIAQVWSTLQKNWTTFLC